MSIRAAIPSDESAVTTLWRECKLVTTYNDPSHDFNFALAATCSDVLVNEDDLGQINGSVMVGHDGHRGWLYYVATSTKARGTGLGRDLIQVAEQWLRERGVKKVQLLVRETNLGVVDFYKHMGFQAEPRVVMSKWLR